MIEHAAVGNHRPLHPGRPMSKHEFTYELNDHLPLWTQVEDADDVEEILASGYGRTRRS